MSNTDPPPIALRAASRTRAVAETARQSLPLSNFSKCEWSISAGFCLSHAIGRLWLSGLFGLLIVGPPWFSVLNVIGEVARS
jgi:hypothetical protein